MQSTIIGKRQAMAQFDLGEGEVPPSIGKAPNGANIYDVRHLTDAAERAQVTRAEAAARQEREQHERERDEREFWAPLRAGRTPTELFLAEWPAELLARLKAAAASIDEESPKYGRAVDLAVSDIMDHYLIGAGGEWDAEYGDNLHEAKRDLMAGMVGCT
jgi:hypothetical protein